MLLALALSTLLAAEEPMSPPPALEPPREAPVEPAVEPPVEPPPLPAPPAATDVPQVEPVSDEAETNQTLIRIGTTALGGAVGIAMPMLLGWGFQLTQAPCGMFMFGCMRDGPISGAAMFLPATVAIGLHVGHSVRGGRAGVGFGLAGGLGGYMVSVAALGLVSLSSGRDWTRTIPGAGAGIIAATSLLGSVAAMELRHTALGAGAKEWKIGRALATGAIFTVPFVVLEGLIILIGTSSRDITNVIVPVFGTLANLLASSLAAWGVHRAMDGRGSFFATIAGALISCSIAAGFLALHFHAPPDRGVGPSAPIGNTSWAMVPVFTFASLIAAVGAPVALEWTDANARPAPTEPEPPGFGDNLQLTGGFGPGGGTIGLAGTF